MVFYLKTNKINEFWYCIFSIFLLMCALLLLELTLFCIYGQWLIWLNYAFSIKLRLDWILHRSMFQLNWMIGCFKKACLRCKLRIRLGNLIIHYEQPAKNIIHIIISQRKHLKYASFSQILKDASSKSHQQFYVSRNSAISPRCQVRHQKLIPSFIYWFKHKHITHDKKHPHYYYHLRYIILCGLLLYYNVERSIEGQLGFFAKTQKIDQN